MRKGTLPLTVALAVAALTGCGGGGFPLTVDPVSGLHATREGAWVERESRLVHVDAEGDAHEVELPGDPYYWDVDGESVWVAMRRTIVRVDARSRRVTGRPVELPGGPDQFVTGIDATATTVWVQLLDDSVHRVDARTGRVLGRPVRVRGSYVDKLVASDDAAYVVSARQARLTPAAWITRVDARTGRVTERPLRERGIFYADVSVGGGGVWVSETREAYAVGRRYTQESGTLTRLDARTLRHAGPPVAVSDDPKQVVHAAGQVWVAHEEAGVVERVDPGTGRVTGPRYRTGRFPVLGTDGRSVFVAASGFGLRGFDGRSGRALGDRERVGEHPGPVVVAGDSVWHLDTPTQDPEVDTEPPWTLRHYGR